MRIEGQRARSGSGLPAGDRPYRWGALVMRVGTQRFARMRYVVTGLMPARIEVQPSNGLGSLIHPNLDLSDASSSVSGKRAPATHGELIPIPVRRTPILQ